MSKLRCQKCGYEGDIVLFRTTKPPKRGTYKKGTWRHLCPECGSRFLQVVESKGDKEK